MSSPPAPSVRTLLDLTPPLLRPARRTASRRLGEAGGIPDIRQQSRASGGGVGGGRVVRVNAGGVVRDGEDVRGALDFVADMKGAMEGAGEVIVQVVCIRAMMNGSSGDAVADVSGNSVVWSGFLTNQKTLFIQVPSGTSFSVGSVSSFNTAAVGHASSSFGFRESVVSVLELAEDVLGVNSLVVCLDKDREDVAVLIRSLLFVGFELVHPSVYDTTNKFVLVGNSL
ncbi:ornithine decarboxylase antizyme-domain-containing protein [Chytriomyces cf. hyalinus JEL632]|nr:ornithine decarboxylase antizyme-domain-containing protein [Chytriomyces cf. hyalinus JEL632]